MAGDTFAPLAKPLIAAAVAAGFAMGTWLTFTVHGLSISVARLEVKIEALSYAMDRMTASNPQPRNVGATERAAR